MVSSRNKECVIHLNSKVSKQYMQMQSKRSCGNMKHLIGIPRTKCRSPDIDVIGIIHGVAARGLSALTTSRRFRQQGCMNASAFGAKLQQNLLVRDSVDGDATSSDILLT